jgi:DNA adenine methylase
MPSTFTPLRYPGGKSQLTPLVVEILRANQLFYGEYCEPFGGGAGIACKLLINGFVSRIHINDLDRSVYAFWKSAIFHTDDFCERIASVKVDIKEWSRQRQIQRNSRSRLLELGFATFFLNRTNRSGIIRGGVIGGQEQSGNFLIDCRFNRSGLIEKIRRLATLRDQITISNVDGNALLQGNRYLTPNTLVNIDPPYYVKGPDLYRNSFTHENHRHLASTVSRLKSKWLVTYDDVPATRTLYKDHPCYTSSLTYSAQDKKTGKEIIVLDRRLNTPLSLLRQKIVS